MSRKALKTVPRCLMQTSAAGLRFASVLAGHPLDQRQVEIGLTQ